MYIYNICVHTASLIVYTYASCFTNLDLTNSWPRKPAAFREPRHLDTAFVGLIFDDKLLHPECSARVSVLPLLIHMGQKNFDVSSEDTWKYYLQGNSGFIQGGRPSIQVSANHGPQSFMKYMIIVMMVIEIIIIPTSSSSAKLLLGSPTAVPSATLFVPGV